jgi:hypothetical protein
LYTGMAGIAWHINADHLHARGMGRVRGTTPVHMLSKLCILAASSGLSRSISTHMRTMSPVNAQTSSAADALGDFCGEMEAVA